jgi:regulatory protein
MPRLNRPDASIARKPSLDRAKLHALALTYVGRYATTRAKLLRYLRRKVDGAEWTDDCAADIEAIASKMVASGFVDDQSFAEMRVTGLSRRGFGERRVRQALWQAGVKPEDTEIALSHVSETPWDVALRFAQRKRFGPYAHKPTSREERQKQVAAFCRAGHDFSIACKILDLNEEFVQDQ